MFLMDFEFVVGMIGFFAVFCALVFNSSTDTTETLGEYWINSFKSLRPVNLPFYVSNDHPCFKNGNYMRMFYETLGITILKKENDSKAFVCKLPKGFRFASQSSRICTLFFENNPIFSYDRIRQTINFEEFWRDENFKKMKQLFPTANWDKLVLCLRCIFSSNHYTHIVEDYCIQEKERVTLNCFIYVIDKKTKTAVIESVQKTVCKKIAVSERIFYSGEMYTVENIESILREYCKMYEFIIVCDQASSLVNLAFEGYQIEIMS